jgi:copper chaperone
MKKISLQVPEVHCDHCKSSIEGAVSGLPGIRAVDVAIAEATVDVDYDEASTNLDDIKKTIEEQGYAVFG